VVAELREAGGKLRKPDAGAGVEVDIHVLGSDCEGLLCVSFLKKCAGLLQEIKAEGMEDGVVIDLRAVVATIV
jgi:hypothetical protein